MDKIVENALNTYFTRLTKVGYANDDMVNSILILLYIENLKEGARTIEEEEIITNALECLQGSCIFPYSTCNMNCSI